jgi:hypothetical protein
MGTRATSPTRKRPFRRVWDVSPGRAAPRRAPRPMGRRRATRSTRRAARDDRAATAAARPRARVYRRRRPAHSDARRPGPELPLHRQPPHLATGPLRQPVPHPPTDRAACHPPAPRLGEGPVTAPARSRALPAGRAARVAKRAGVAAVSTTLLGTGAALLVLPGPGLLVVVAGLAVLATESAWAERRLHQARAHAAKAARRRPAQVPPNVPDAARPSPLRRRDRPGAANGGSGRGRKARATFRESRIA